LPRQARIIKARLDVDELRERNRIRPRQRLALPSPRPAVASIAVTVIEVQAGVRSPWHLERVSHYSLWPVWDRFARPASADPAATVARPLAILVQETTPGLVNATVIVQFAGTVEPLALALDGARGWWELMELECSSGLTPDPPAAIPGPIAALGRVDDPPLPRRLPDPPTELSLPWADRWPGQQLDGDLDPLEGPSIDFG
jgi:Family of unknown function (DUF6459)